MGTPEERWVYEFGPYRLDTAAQLLYSATDGRPVPLTPRVYDTLRVLVEHAGELVDKRTLMAAAWPHVVVEDNNLDQAISALRQALGERRGDYRYIVTVRGRGYRFAAPVARRPAPREAAGSSDPAEEAPAQASSAASRPPGVRRVALGVASAGVAAIALAGAFALSHFERIGVGTAAASQALAVLPFRPLTPTDANESLALGMAETLIAGLGGERLAVRPLSAVRRFSSVDEDAVAAGRELAVDAVLEGHMQRDGDRLRVSARLLDVGTGRQLWAEAYDEPFTDLFSVQDAIAGKVAAALAPGIRPSNGTPEVPRYTEDPEAYQLYVNGRFHRQRYREAGLRQALEYFEQAARKDPSFALAHVGISETYAILGVFAIEVPHEVFPRARRAVDEALRLDPTLGAAHASLGHIKAQYEHDWAGAEAALRRAIAESPSYAPAHQWLGLYLAYSGRFAEGLQHLRQAQALEPSAPGSSALVGMVLTYERRYDEAVMQLRKTLEMDADLPTAHTYLALAYIRRGEYDAALEHLARVSSPTPGVMGYVGQAYALSGRRAEAAAEAERLEALARERYVPAYDIAGIHAALGNRDRAFEWLGRAFDERAQLIGWLPWDAVFDGLRDDPRYPVALRRLPARQ